MSTATGHVTDEHGASGGSSHMCLITNQIDDNQFIDPGDGAEVIMSNVRRDTDGYASVANQLTVPDDDLQGFYQVDGTLRIGYIGGTPPSTGYIEIFITVLGSLQLIVPWQEFDSANEIGRSWSFIEEFTAGTGTSIQVSNQTDIGIFLRGDSEIPYQRLSWWYVSTNESTEPDPPEIDVP